MLIVKLPKISPYGEISHYPYIICILSTECTDFPPLKEFHHRHGSHDIPVFFQPFPSSYLTLSDVVFHQDSNRSSPGNGCGGQEITCAVNH